MTPELFSSHYYVFNFAIACVMLVLCVMIAGIHIPHRKEWNHFRMAVKMIGLACFVLGTDNIMSIFFRTENSESGFLLPLIMVDVAMFQALLFTMTSIVLVLPDAVRWRLVARHLIVLLGMMIVNVGGFVMFPEFRSAFVVVACIFYSGYITYLTILFQRSFKIAVNHLEALYDEDILSNLRWVRIFFYGALVVGLMALVSAIFPFPIVYNLFKASVPVYYCYAVVQLMNYVVTSAYVVKVPAPAPATTSFLSASVDEVYPNSMQDTVSTISPASESALTAVAEALDFWVASRGYAKGDMTVDEIIVELGVKRQDFVAYFKTVLGIKFRTWRNRIRIEAAMHLIDTNADITVGELMESVGFNDRSNFHKHFQSVSGVSLKEYRTSVLARKVKVETTNE